MSVILDNGDTAITASSAGTTVPRRFNVIAAEGIRAEHRVASRYVKQHWRREIGLTAEALAEHVDWLLSNSPRDAVDTEALADQFDVSQLDIIAAIGKLQDYGLAEWSPREALLTLKRRWPDVAPALLTKRHHDALHRLPDELP